MLPHCKNCCQQLVLAADAGEETFGPLPPITPTVLLQVFTAAIYSSRERVFEAQQLSQGRMMACAFRNGSIHVALSLCVFAAAGGEAPGTEHNRAALTHCENGIT